MDKFEEHMCPPKTHEFVRESGEKDTFTFQPLGFEHMPKFFRLIKKFYKSVGKEKVNKDDMSDEDVSNFMDTLDDESLNLIKDLIESMMEESYSSEFKTPEGKNKMSKFMARNMMDLMSILIEMNSPHVSPDVSKVPKTMGAKDEPTGQST